MTALPAPPAPRLGASPLLETFGPPGAAAGRMSRASLAVFSGPSLPISALGLPLAVYLPEFYANVIGVKLSAVALIFLCIRLFDLSLDPLLGGLMDRTRTRFGCFKPWLCAGAPVLMVCAYMTFMARPGAGAFSLAFWLSGLYLAYSILILSHSAWASTLSSDYHERSRIYGWMQGGLVLAMVFVPALAAAAAGAYPSVAGAGVHAIGWFVILLAPATIALTCWRTPEAPAPARPSHRGRLRDYLRLAVRPAVRRILAADLLLAFGPATTAALFFFFFREAKGYSTTQANLLLVIYFTGGFLGTSLWTALARRIGKHRALIAAAVYYAAMQLGWLLAPIGAFVPGAILIFSSGLSYSAPTLFIRAMMADAADEADLDQGRPATGMLYALISSTAKISSALAIFVTFAALGAIGFAPKAHAQNSAEALVGLKALFIVLPAASALLGAVVLRRYAIDQTRHDEIRRLLQARDAAAGSAPGLTGRG